MPAWVAAAATVGGALISADSSRSAANTQSDAAKAAAAANAAQQQPWIDAAKPALQNLQTGLAPGGQYNKPFTMADAKNSQAEQYAQQQMGQQVQNSAAAKGGLINSNTMQELQTNAGNIASQYENQAFNQNLQTNQQQLGAMQSLAQVGQTSAMNVGDTNANAILASGGAQAGATMAQGNAITSGIGQIGNILGQSGVFSPSQNQNPYTSPNSSGGYANPTTGSSGAGIDQFSNLGGAATAGDYSDERLKENVQHVGQTPAGLPVYTFNMKGERKDRRKTGVMAQDVEKVVPAAVKKDRSGFRMVDYAMVP